MSGKIDSQGMMKERERERFQHGETMRYRKKERYKKTWRKRDRERFVHIFV